MNKTSDYIPYNLAIDKANQLLNTDPKFGFFIIFSANVGLRISDILKIKYSDVKKGKIELKEDKTDKVRIITINKTVLKYLNKMVVNDDDYIIDYTVQYINKKMKEVFWYSGIQISTHSLRKCFARAVYEKNKKSEYSLALLSDLFNHSSMSMTRKYLGLRTEEFTNVYLSL